MFRIFPDIGAESEPAESESESTAESEDQNCDSYEGIKASDDLDEIEITDSERELVVIDEDDDEYDHHNEYPSRQTMLGTDTSIFNEIQNEYEPETIYLGSSIFFAKESHSVQYKAANDVMFRLMSMWLKGYSITIEGIEFCFIGTDVKRVNTISDEDLLSYSSQVERSDIGIERIIKTRGIR